MLTKGKFTRDEWNHLLCLFNISHFSSTECSEVMSKRTQKDSGEERVTAKSKPMMNLVSRCSARNPDVLASTASESLGKTRHESQSSLCVQTEQHYRTGRPVVYAHSSSCSEWNVDKTWSSQEWKFDKLMEVRTGRLVVTAQHTNRFIIEHDSMDSEFEAESEMYVVRIPRFPSCCHFSKFVFDPIRAPRQREFRKATWMRDRQWQNRSLWIWTSRAWGKFFRKRKEIQTAQGNQSLDQGGVPNRSWKQSAWATEDGPTMYSQEDNKSILKPQTPGGSKNSTICRSPMQGTWRKSSRTKRKRWILQKMHHLWGCKHTKEKI